MSVFDLSGVLVSLGTGSYTVTRRGASSYDSSGVRQAASTTTFSILGVLHPLSGRETQRLPEGMRTREPQALLTQVELQGAGAGEPDTVSANGDTWEVGVVERWQELGNFWRCVLLKVGP